jgi:hypothetical protein
MGAPVTLLLVVGLSGGEVRSGQLQATLTTHLDSSQVQLQVRRADGVFDLEQMLEAAAARGPVAVVTNPRTGRLEIRVALQPGKWVQRGFTFSARDPLRERNRTVALAIAAMTPEWRLPQPLPEPDPEPESPALVPQLGELDARPIPAIIDAGAVEPEPTPGPSLEPSDAGVLEVLDAGPPIVAQLDPPPAVVASPSGFTFELAALGSTWPLGAGAQLGAAYCSLHLCLGLDLRGQRADLGPAQAAIWHAGGQVIGRLQTRLGADRLRGALQLAVGPGWLLAQRGGQTQSRWQLEVDLAPELALRVSASVWLFLRTGVGVVSGPTPILVDATQVAELPIVTGHATLGVRLDR